MQSLTKLEENNRKHLLDLIHQIPNGPPPGWSCNTLAVGGLMYIGFSERHTNKLVCISSRGQSIINCETLKKTYCDECFDEENLTAQAEEFGTEQIRIAGEGGGGLRHYSRDGNSLERAAPFWPKEQVIFMPQFHSWHTAPGACRIVFDAYELKAYGFSKCGAYFVVATSSDLTIFQKQAGG